MATYRKLLVTVIAEWLRDAMAVRTRKPVERRRGAGRPTRYEFHPHS
jgi:hypothetical protein